MNKTNNLTHLTDERFVAQLGIVSIQSRIEEDNPLNRRWTSRFEIGDSLYHIEGFAADFGRPRGVDTDILLALETLFMCQGCPKNNTVTTTAYEIVQMVYQNTSGVLYKRLRESLLRLWRVGFMVTRGHIHPESSWGRFANISLSLIDSVQFWTKGKRHESPELHEMEAHGKLVIRFSEPMAESIRAGYYQHLDRKLLAELEQPVARALYRILQAHRPANDVLTCKVSDWGSLCGIIATDPRKIRRTLESAHDELKANGYLEDVDYVGRGANQEVTYRYRVAGSADPALVELLMSVDIPRPRAQQIAAEFPDRVEAVVHYVRSRKGTRNKGGLTVDMLYNPDKYKLPDAPSTPTISAEDARKATRQAERAAEQAADAEFQARQAVLLALDPTTQWENCCSTIRLLTKGVLAESGLAQLEALCRAGEVSAAELSRKLSPIVSKTERSAFILTFARQHALNTVGDSRRAAQPHRGH